VFKEDIHDAPSANPARKFPLDGPRAAQLHARLMAYYEAEIERQSDNRAEMHEDEQVYDNKQWSDTDAETLKDRGQVPLVYNVTATSIDWIIGTERRARADFRVLPRRKDNAAPAERKTQLLKYLSDANRLPFSRSRAFADAAKVGIGWLEDGIQDDVDGEPVYSRYESWRNILWDSAANELDLSDARYIFRSRWLDYDIGAAMFPNRKELIQQSCTESAVGAFTFADGDEAMDAQEDLQRYAGWTASEYSGRPRFRAIEAWFKVPCSHQRLRGGDYTGEIYEPGFAAHEEELDSGRADLVDRPFMRTHCAIMTISGLLWFGESPYRHNAYPFTPVWCYRDGETGLPYGVIRRIKSIQFDINKRAAKALAILSSNKTLMEEGAVSDLDEWAEEAARPDAILVYKEGKNVQLNVDRDLAPAHIELMSRSIALIQSVSGVTDEAMGRTTNASSGVAIQRRQDQAGLATAQLFDNWRYASQIQGEKQLSNIEQSYSDEKTIRITNTRGQPEYVTLNDGLPENDIIATKADFIITEQDWNATLRQAQVTELLQLMGQIAPVNPQFATVMMDLVIEAMDIPQRDELVKRVRQITGMKDPDADPNAEPTPEEMAQAQQQAQQQQFAQAMQQVELALKQAGVNEKNALAAQRQAEAQVKGFEADRSRAQTASTNIDAALKALQAAVGMLNAPSAVPIADQMLHEAGFQSRTEQEEDARQSGIMQGEEAARQQEVAAEQQAAMEQAAAEQQAQQQQDPQDQIPQE
jgi:hypothetical protein